MQNIINTKTKVTDQSLEFLKRIFLKEMELLNLECWKYIEREKVVNVSINIGMPKEFVNQLKTYL